MARAIAAVSASNKRIRKMELKHARTRESLETMLATFNIKRHGDEADAEPNNR
jgi:hypothetical protein